MFKLDESSKNDFPPHFYNMMFLFQPTTMKMRLHYKSVHLLSSTLVIPILFLDVLHDHALFMILKCL